MAQSAWSANISDSTNGGFKLQLLFASLCMFHKNICRDVWKDLEISILSHEGYSLVVMLGFLLVHHDIPMLFLRNPDHSAMHDPVKCESMAVVTMCYTEH